MFLGQVHEHFKGMLRFVFQAHQRLIPQAERTLFQRLANLHGHRFRRPGSHIIHGIMHFHRIALAGIFPLGLVATFQRGGEGFLAATGIFAHKRHPHTGGDMHGLGGHFRHQGFNAGPQGFCQFGRLIHIGYRLQNGKILAIHPGQMGLSHLGTQPFGHAFQNVIRTIKPQAGLMVLKVIQTQIQHGGQAPLIGGLGHTFVHTVHEPAAAE